MRGSRIPATLAVCVALAASPLPAGAVHRDGPCHVHRREGEPVRRHAKRLIRCATGRWSVPGGARKAICIADAESGLNPRARAKGRTYLGLFQHLAAAWPDRYEEWTRRSWNLKPSALSGRTNAIVTIRMVNAQGWGPWRGVGDC